MAIPIIGSIYTSMRTAELTAKWQLKMQQPKWKQLEEEDPERVSLLRDAERLRESNAISALDGKLKAGGELTDEDLAYLKAKSPQLYQEAMDIKREREAYKKQLEACKTKDDVEKVRAQKIQSFLSTANAITSNANLSRGQKCQLMEKILRRVMGVEGEHTQFIKTTRYQQLPTEEKLEKAKEAEQARREQATDASTEPQESAGEPDVSGDVLLDALQQELAGWTKPDDHSAKESDPPKPVVYTPSGTVIQPEREETRPKVRRKA